MKNLQVIVGLGITGLACTRYLVEKGFSVAIADTRQNPPHLAECQHAFPDITYSLGKLDHNLLNQADRIILSPGLSRREEKIAEQIKKGTPVIGDIELFAQAINVPLIAITGTNAKSTVTTLVGEMAKKAGMNVQVGGNLGVAALDLLKNSADVFVLELSSFQLESTYSLKPTVASILNITPDHMDRYETLADYQAAKHRVYQNAEKVVFNRDDPLTYTDIKPQINFTLSRPSVNEFGIIKNSQDYLGFEDQCLMPIKDLPIVGKHYQANALAALAIGYQYGLSLDAMLEVLREFKGLPHRCQFVRKLNDVSWYNDSKGTNTGATVAAIDGLGSEIEGKLILIAGGVGKGADFTTLNASLKKYVRHVVLIGEAAEDIAAAIKDHTAFSHATNLEEAILKSKQLAKSNDSVLLSPACASFDMFKDFAHRGKCFMEIVQRL